MINIDRYAPLLTNKIFTLEELLELFETTDGGHSFLQYGMYEVLTKRATAFKTAFQSLHNDNMQVFFGIRWSWLTSVGTYIWIFYWGESPAGITDGDPPKIFLREVPGIEGILYVADDGPTTWESFPMPTNLLSRGSTWLT